MNLRQLRVLALAKQQPQAAKQQSQGRGAPLNRCGARAAGGESPEPEEPLRSVAASLEPDGTGGGGRRRSASLRLIPRAFAAGVRPGCPTSRRAARTAQAAAARRSAAYRRRRTPKRCGCGGWRCKRDARGAALLAPGVPRRAAGPYANHGRGARAPATAATALGRQRARGWPRTRRWGPPRRGLSCAAGHTRRSAPHCVA